MATGALPLGFSPLGDDGQSTNPIAQLLHDTGRNRQDEDLAFAAGLSAPSSNGTSGALGNAFKAQIDLREKKDALMAQYVPLIQQAMVQNFEMNALGNTYGDGQGGQPQGQVPQGSQAPQAAGPQGAGMPAAANGVVANTTATANPPPQIGGNLFDRAMRGTLAQAMQGDAMTGGRFGLANAWKLANEGIKQEGGAYYKNPLTGQQTYNIKYPEGVGPQGAAPGAVEGTADLAGAKTGAEKTAEARTTPLPPTFIGSNGKPVGGSIADYLGIGKPQGSNPDADRALILSSGLDQSLARLKASAATNDQPTIQRSTEDVMGFIKEMKRSNVGYVPPEGRVPLGSVTPQAVAQAEATPSGTPSLQSPAAGAGQKTAAEEQAKSGQAYQNALHDKVEEEFQLVQRNKQILPLLARYNTGGIAPEERLKIGAAIANSGSLQSILGVQNAKAIGDKLAGGDIVAGKDLENQLASAGILTMLQTLDKEGKPNRAIFQAVQQAQEGLKSGNATLRDVFDLQSRLYGIHYNEQQALTQAIKDGTYDPRTWAGDYSKVRNQQLQEPAAPLPSSGFNAKPSPSTSKFPGFSAVVKGS